MVIEDGGKTVFFDHHTDKSGRASSSTKITYEVLTNLGLLKKEEYLDKLTEFVTQMDNRTYPEEEKHFKDSWQNLLGLQRYIPFNKLLVCFRGGKLPHENLSEKEIEQLGLKKRSQEQKRLVESSLQKLEEMKNEGLIIDSEHYGKIAVDIDKRVPAGFDAAKAIGCGGYIIWNPKEKSFFLSTIKSLADDFNLSQGKRIRETMWIKPRFDESPLEIKLEEILNKMTDGKFEATGKLKEFLEEDLQRGKDRELEDKIQEIIKKANLGEKLSEQEMEFLKEFKTSKEQRQKEWEEFNEQPLIKEIKDLTEKKQKDAPLSEEEQKRIQILQLRLDIINRNREKIEEESLPEAEETQKGIKLLPEQKKNIESKFTEFGIKKEEIEKIEGFKDLSYGQKLLVVENLKQLTFGRIQEEALVEYKKDTIEYKFLGKIYNGITKKYQIAKIEKQTAEDIKKGGLKTHGEILKQLINGMKNLGLEVIENEKNELEIQYVSGLENLTPEQKQKIKEFNQIATQFSKMPYEWFLSTASKDQQIKFNKVKEEYEKFKGDILTIKEQKSNKEESFLYISDIDNKLRLNQFLNTNPEIEKELENIKSSTAWVEALKDIVTERGLLFGAGFITRTATISLLGTIGLPIAAAIMGGYMGRKRAKESLQEHEILSRKGIKDVSKEAKNFITTENLSSKIDLLIEKINLEQDEIKKNELLESLRMRLEYSESKLNEGLVDFGVIDKRIVNQYNLIDKLNFGYSLTSFGEKSRNELQERLESFLALKERNISEMQKKYLRDQMVRGAIFGVGFATAGYAIRHFAGEWFDWGNKHSIVKSELSKIPSDKTIIEEVLINKKPEIQGTAVAAVVTQEEMQKVFEKLDIKEISVQKGDNLWSIIGKKFDKLNWGDNYKELAKGQKTYAIDFIKDKLAAMSPEELKEIGIKSGNIDKLNIGDKIDLSKIINEENISNAVERAQNLTPEQIGNIEKGQGSILKEILKPAETEISGTDEKVFDVFDKQDRLGKWKTIQIYQNDIDAIKSNLDKFPDPEVKASIQAEINRLENVKTSFVDRLAEQTEQIAIAGLSPEKTSILNNLIYEDNRYISEKVDDLIKNIDNKKISIEDFGNYYANKLGADKPSNELLNNLKNNFKAISEGMGGEKLKAKRALEVILQRLEKIK